MALPLPVIGQLFESVPDIIIFARPGAGLVIYDAVVTRNFPVVQGAVLIITALYIVITLLADLAVAWLDPRVRESL